MKIFRCLEDIRGAVRNPVVTVGSFDGVHVGHRFILAELRRIAAETGGESVVVTFDPHPRTIVHNSDSRLRLLNTLKEKIYLLESVGIDNLFVINFDAEFSRLSYADFTRIYLLDGIGAKTIISGYNHQFGHNRAGDITYLERMHTDYDFEIRKLPEQAVDNSKVSSTIIRKLILAGDITAANACLGDRYIIISQADSCGRLILDNPDKLLPRAGKYPVTVLVDGVLHDAVLEVAGSESAKLLCCPELPVGVDLVVRF